MASYSQDEYLTDNGWLLAGTGDAGGSLEEAQTVVLDPTEGKVNIRGSVGFSLPETGDIDYRDYYSFTALETGRFNIDLTGLDGFAFTRLFQSDGTQIGHTLEGTTDDKKMVYTLDGGQGYYVLVDAYGTSESNYELSIDGLSTQEINPLILPPDYDYSDRITSGDFGDLNGDARDELISASLVSLGTDGVVEIAGTTGYDDQNDEQDCYNFEAGVSGDARISLTGLADNLFIRLYDSLGTQLVISETSGSSDKLIEYPYLSAGEFYSVVVDPYGDAESPYILTIETPEIAGSNDYTDEASGNPPIPGGDAGNTNGSAALIDLVDSQVAVNGSVGFDEDVQDWYSFSVPAAAGLLSVRLTGLNDDVSMVLYGSDNVEVWRSAASSADQAGNVDVTSGEVYRLLVDPGNSSASYYNLAIEASELPTVVVPDTVNGTPVVGGDAGNTPTSAAGVPDGVTGDVQIVGFTGSPDDRGDYYSFTSPLSGEVEIVLSDFTGLFDAKLFDFQSDVSTSSGHAVDDTILLNPVLTAGESYVVAVIPDLFGERVGSNYQLSLSAPEADTGDSINQVPVDGGDAGNQLAESVEVPLMGNTVISGHVGGNIDSADYYQLVLPDAAGTLTVDLTGFAANISLAGEAGELPHQEYIYTFNASETYNLVVASSTAAELDYTFTVDVAGLPSSVGRDDTLNGDPVNGGDASGDVSLAELIDLGLGDFTVAGSVTDSEDLADYYRVELPTLAGTGILDLTNFGATLSVELDGQMVQMSNEVITFDFSGGDSYNLLVVPPVGGVNDYAFGLSTSVARPGNDTDDIINDAPVAGGDASDLFNAPLSVPLDATGSLYIQGAAGYGTDNGDCYQFAAASSGNISIALTQLSDSLSAQLYDNTGTLLVSTTPNSNDDQVVSYSNVHADENYVVVVDPYLGAESMYHLDLVMA